jgi:hypothetical protein
MNFHDELERLQKYGIYDLSDVYTDEEIKDMCHQKQEEQYKAPVSMDSLGLTWRDFF